MKIETTVQFIPFLHQKDGSWQSLLGLMDEPPTTWADALIKGIDKIGEIGGTDDELKEMVCSMGIRIEQITHVSPVDGHLPFPPNINLPSVSVSPAGIMPGCECHSNQSE